MMSIPVNKFDLNKKDFQVNTSALALKDGETDGFFIGTENGHIH